MDLVSLYLDHAVWWWVAAAAAFLAVEVATGTSYLLWPAAAAAVVGVLTAAIRMPPWADVGLFAVLTIAATLAARRFMPRTLPTGPDINDPHHRIAGRHGICVGPFVRGEGRVFVDGKEWAAELDGAGELGPGEKIEVARVLDGGRLKVRPV